MKTNLSTSARFQTGLLVATASLGLLAVALVFPLRASSAMPAMPAAASAGQPVPAGAMPMSGMMNADMGAMMKNMSTMMDKMSGMMAAGQTPAKTDAMPMADMARMSEMMKNMGAMMGIMGGAPGKADTMGGMCPCCEKMMAGMDMMGGSQAMAKPAPQPGDAKPATAAGDAAAPDATDHSAHH